MSHLALYLFGGFHAELNGKPLTAFGTDKNRALLAYLAVESGHTQRRETLAALLWPEHPESIARNSLRQALYHLQCVLQQKSDIEPYLLITPKEVQFNPASDHWVDVEEFQILLFTSQSQHPSGNSLSDVCLKSLQRAIELYQGDLLEGFTLPRCSQFTDWQIINQEICHQQVLAALALLAIYYETNLEYEQLIATTLTEIKLEPWRESAYRRQMWALAMTGQREKALVCYRTLKEVLMRELGIAPSDKIRQLFEEIREGDLPGLRLTQVEPSLSLKPVSQAPVVSDAPVNDQQLDQVDRQDILFNAKDRVFSYRISGIVIRDGKVLLQHVINDPTYAFPGGHVNFGETSEEALIREFKEKIGVEFKPERLLWIGENFFPWGMRECHQICLFYLGALRDDTQIPHEGSFSAPEPVEFCWIPVSDLEEIELFPTPSKEKLKDLADHIEKYVLVD